MLVLHLDEKTVTAFGKQIVANGKKRDKKDLCGSVAVCGSLFCGLLIFFFLFFFLIFFFLRLGPDFLLGIY